MNICFCTGKVVSDVKFSFTLRKNPYSVATFKIKLSNDSIINIYTINEKADWCYRKIKENDNVVVYGELNDKITVKVIANDIGIIYGNIVNSRNIKKESQDNNGKKEKRYKPKKKDK